MELDWSLLDWAEIGVATWDTLRMLGWSLFFTVLFGLPLGVLLFLTSRRQLLANGWLNRVLSFVANVLRSVPFLILLVVMIPVTAWLVGTSLGVEGSIPPLVVGATPFFARLVETALREVDRGVIEAVQSLGATRWQIVWKVLLPESRPGLMAAVTVTAITLVSYTAMSGVIGGGGLGDLAIRYGYQRFQTEVMIVTVVILIAMVQALQMAGDWLVARVSRK
ncbi:D-methionine transport system permease protein [Crenobacter luteus]|uniref:methionine ABC transporter permease n=1 Tax=Crenobacter luteus TaxID=1452487 RepID=UPI0010E8B539|nr:methionine ABC transporter permease [Crenobacter luteus]TCP10854.1 D-methionine transport system permease protein [Crenobacter luteus]